MPVSSRLKFVIAIVVATGLVLTGAYAWAQPQYWGDGGHRGHQWRALRGVLIGTVASVSNGTLTVTTRNGASVTIHTGAGTSVISRQQSKVSDLQAGDFVTVVAGTAPNGTVNARVVRAVSSTLAAPGGVVRRQGPMFGPGRKFRGRGAQGGMPNGLWARGAGTVVAVGRLAGPPANGTIAVTLPAGPPLRVTVAANAPVSRLGPAPVSRLAAGTRVLVRGRPNPDRSINASSILILPAQLH